MLIRLPPQCLELLLAAASARPAWRAVASANPLATVGSALTAAAGRSAPFQCGYSCAAAPPADAEPAQSSCNTECASTTGARCRAPCAFRPPAALTSPAPPAEAIVPVVAAEVRRYLSPTNRTAIDEGRCLAVTGAICWIPVHPSCGAACHRPIIALPFTICCTHHLDHQAFKPAATGSAAELLIAPLVWRLRAHARWDVLYRAIALL